MNHRNPMNSNAEGRMNRDQRFQYHQGERQALILRLDLPPKPRSIRGYDLAVADLRERMEAAESAARVRPDDRTLWARARTARWNFEAMNDLRESAMEASR